MKNKLHFMCGKMASGKSTLSKKLANEHNAILLSEDELLKKLYPNEINTIQDYAKYSTLLKEALTEHIIELLIKGNNVVLDFPANTISQREWFKKIFEKADIEHTLYYVSRSDEVCKKQLKERNKNLSKDEPLIDEATFDAITKYFQEPKADENFNIKVY
ncbi:cell division protein ZipA [Arcobacter sp. CECT 8986]|uniref:AAA family ATPase n=1 Tax=Arcobacter sp. CECT 8986 TaxID=2044507 RepID=UPI0010098972|nr:ATP-binding protein [Arcobacter sp. CECT 8986]RXK00482.1 cell division protein ZipA [Arcobacter sp. CECT 8986]